MQIVYLISTTEMKVICRCQFFIGSRMVWYCVYNFILDMKCIPSKLQYKLSLSGIHMWPMIELLLLLLFAVIIQIQWVKDVFYAIFDNFALVVRSFEDVHNLMYK